MVVGVTTWEFGSRSRPPKDNIKGVRRGVLAHDNFYNVFPILGEILGIIFT